jgi:hypothetical protein
VERLRAAGITASQPEKSGRKRPDGVQLDWETAQIGPGRGTFFPFLIHDFTPRERRAYPSGKPTTTQWTGITKVVIAVNDLDAAIRQVQRAYALPPPERQDDADFGAKLAFFRGTPVVLATPFTAQSWLAERIRRFGEGPCAFIVGSEHGLIGANHPSVWFGKPVTWSDRSRLGWHLGFEAK